MRAQAFHQQPAGAVGLLGALDFRSLVNERVAAEAGGKAETQLPLLGHAAGGGIEADGAFGRGFLPLEVSVDGNVEKPVVPAVRPGGRAVLRRITDLETRGDGRPDDISGQALLKRPDQPLPDVVLGIVFFGVIADRIVDPGKTVPAHERQGIFLAFGSRCLGRDQDMDVGFLPVPDIIDERDFVLDVLEVAASAIDEDPGCGFFQRFQVIRRRLGGPWKRGEQASHQGENGRLRDFFHASIPFLFHVAFPDARFMPESLSKLFQRDQFFLRENPLKSYKKV